jgi:hypothetical protein
MTKKMPTKTSKNPHKSHDFTDFGTFFKKTCNKTRQNHLWPTLPIYNISLEHNKVIFEVFSIFHTFSDPYHTPGHFWKFVFFLIFRIFHFPKKATFFGDFQTCWGVVWVTKNPKNRKNFKNDFFMYQTNIISR